APDDLVGRVLARLRAGAEQGRTLLVLALHPGEVRMGVRLSVQQLVDESLLVVVREVGGPPGELPLVADGRGREGPEGLAAGGAGAVAREDLDMIGQGEELGLQGREQLLRTGEAGVLHADGL